MLQGLGFQRFASEPSEGTGVALAEFDPVCQRVAREEPSTGAAVALAAELFARGRSAALSLSLRSS
jgi:hypothetical protein